MIKMSPEVKENVLNSKVLVTPWVNPQVNCICNCLIKIHI